MSEKVNYITLQWSGGAHRFRLRYPPHGLPIITRWGTVEPLGTLYARLNAGVWTTCDLLAIVRTGLVGGGMAGDDADRLVQARLVGRPAVEAMLMAQAIVSAAVVGLDAAKADTPITLATEAEAA